RTDFQDQALGTDELTQDVLQVEDVAPQVGHVAVDVGQRRVGQVREPVDLLKEAVAGAAAMPVRLPEQRSVVDRTAQNGAGRRLQPYRRRARGTSRTERQPRR